MLAPPYWRLRDGSLVHIKDMTSVHLANCIRLMVKRAIGHKDSLTRMLQQEIEHAHLEMEGSAFIYVLAIVAERHWSTYLHPIWPEMRSELESRYEGQLSQSVCEKQFGKNFYEMLNLTYEGEKNGGRNASHKSSRRGKRSKRH